jgi:hypothetical protein
MSTSLRWILTSLITLLALHFSTPAAADLQIGNYVLISTQRVTRTDFEYTFKAAVLNTEPDAQDAKNVTATLISSSPDITVIDGDLSFGDVAAGAITPSIDTFTIRVNRLKTFNPSMLAWSVKSVLAEQRSTLGPGRTILALPDVGEIELAPDATRPSAELVIRQVRAPQEQQIFIQPLPPSSTISYTNSMIEIVSNVEITTPVAVRLLIPQEFAKQVPPNQRVQLYVKVGDDVLGSRYVSLNAVYNSVSGIAWTTIMPAVWQKVGSTKNATSLAALGEGTVVTYSVDIQIGTYPNGPWPNILRGDFTDIALTTCDSPKNLSVTKDQQLNLHTSVYIDRPWTTGYPASQVSISSDYYALRGGNRHHWGIDYSNGSSFNILAAHSGELIYKCQTTGTCGQDSNGNQIPSSGYCNNNPLFGYGYYAKILFPNANNPEYTTIYGHLEPGDPNPPQGSQGAISEGTLIGRAGNTGCSTGTHLHYELQDVGSRAINPHYYFDPLEQSQVPLERNFRIALNLYGNPLSATEQQLQQGVKEYDFTLDLNQFSLNVGQNLTLALDGIDTWTNERRPLACIDLAVVDSLLTITSTTPLPGGIIGKSYTTTLAASGGISPYTWSLINGTLPKDLALNSTTGEISGTPSIAGNSSFTLQVSDALGGTATKDFTLAVTSSTSVLTITTLSPLPTGIVGTAYNTTLQATGGVTPYTWSLANGSLPPGIALDKTTGKISGTPTIVGSNSFTVQVSDDSGGTAKKDFTLLTVTPTSVLTITTLSPLPTGIVGEAYTMSLLATGGVLPYTWSIVSGTLPPGLSLNRTIGLISGNPTTIGSSTFRVRVTDSSSPSQTAELDLSMDVKTPTVYSSIWIMAKGTPAGGVWPKAQIFKDVEDEAQDRKRGSSRQVIGEITVTSNEYKLYEVPNITLSDLNGVAGAVVGILFMNDDVVNGEDRNLWIDYVTIEGITFQADGPGVRYQIPNSSGFEWIAGQKAMYWYGVLEFPLDNNFIDVEASGSAYSCNGEDWPKMELWVNNLGSPAIYRQPVTWSPYSADGYWLFRKYFSEKNNSNPTNIGDIRNLYVKYINDCNGPGGDRNLFVKSVTFGSTARIMTSDPRVCYERFDGAPVTCGTGAMYWGGRLIFDKAIPAGGFQPLTW